MSYDGDIYWEMTEDSYPHYPTVRHRKRFILHALKKTGFGPEKSFFDYGCGEGEVLSVVKARYGLTDTQIGGCDPSSKAVEIARRKISSPYLVEGSSPDVDRQFDCVTCSEVVEHTPAYEGILRWIEAHLVPGGTLILTTQAGKIHACDRYTGHTQHFRMRDLAGLLERLGFTVKKARLWGFPFFTAQKYLTDYRFETVQKNYLEGNLSFRKRLVFTTAYVLYFMHDLIRLGPQIYIIASR